MNWFYNSRKIIILTFSIWFENLGRVDVILEFFFIAILSVSLIRFQNRIFFFIYKFVSDEFSFKRTMVSTLKNQPFNSVKLEKQKGWVQNGRNSIFYAEKISPASTIDTQYVFTLQQSAQPAQQCSAASTQNTQNMKIRVRFITWLNLCLGWINEWKISYYIRIHLY